MIILVIGAGFQCTKTRATLGKIAARNLGL